MNTTTITAENLRYGMTVIVGQYELKVTRVSVGAKRVTVQIGRDRRSYKIGESVTIAA